MANSPVRVAQCKQKINDEIKSCLVDNAGDESLERIIEPHMFDQEFRYQKSRKKKYSDKNDFPCFHLPTVLPTCGLSSGSRIDLEREGRTYISLTLFVDNLIE
ncbi:MAG: hypothetical protein ACYC9O_14045, partial [Candidatus Latescibacterota bacterium]